MAPALAKTHTVIIPDLPGYGASQTLDRSTRWNKRRVAAALVEMMDKLGHDRFALVGHDRGARAGYRLALDYVERVSAYASLTVVPTLDAMQAIDFRSAANAFHWFLLAQEDDLPERMLASDPDMFLERAFARMTGGRDFIEPSALEAYRHAFREPSVRHAMCEDYRAALHEDLAFDEVDRAAGHKMPCPVLVLWPAADSMAERPTPVDIWEQWASTVSGVATSGGHLQPEDAPNEVLESLVPFLALHQHRVHEEKTCLPDQS